VPLTSVHAGKCRTEDKLRIESIHELNTIQKNKQHKTQQNKTRHSSFVTRPGNEVGLFYNVPKPKRSKYSKYSTADTQYSHLDCYHGPWTHNRLTGVVVGFCLFLVPSFCSVFGCVSQLSSFIMLSTSKQLSMTAV